MKKIILILLVAMTCERVTTEGWNAVNLYRCENDEVICYSGGFRSGLSCKFKDDVK